MVRECDEPFVGLQHIIEIFPLDDSGKGILERRKFLLISGMFLLVNNKCV